MISPLPPQPVDGNPVPDPRGGEKIWRVGTLSYTRRGLARLFFWLLFGDFALNVRDRAVPPVMQLLFKKFGASDLVVGLIFSSLPAALGMIIGPTVAYRSDRLRTPWGRRIPFLIFPIPFFVISMIGLAFCPQLGERLSHLLGTWSPGLNGSAVIVMAVFWTLFEISCFIGYAVFAAMINDVVPQAVVGRFYGLFRAVGLIAGIIFFYYVNDNAEKHAAWIFLGIGALYGIGFTIVCSNVKEGGYPPPPASEKPGLLFAVKTYFKDGLGNPYYLWYFAATILGAFSSGPFNLYSIFYAKSLGMHMPIYFKCIALSYVCSLVLSYPLGSLADRFHPLRLSMVGLALYALVMACGGLWVRDASTFTIAFVAHNVVSGSIFTAWASLQQRLLPRNKFAEIGSVGGILGACCGMLLTPAVGEFLDYMHHDYRYTFFISAGFTILALGAFLVLHHRFMALGGPKNYVAPE
ncbi:MAG: MFS transporter [Methylacidiphilales bacterium]|nr:MFS transporter [Candidatus Methylacidiphilales bacterium]